MNKDRNKRLQAYVARAIAEDIEDLDSASDFRALDRLAIKQELETGLIDRIRMDD